MLDSAPSRFLSRSERLRSASLPCCLALAVVACGTRRGPEAGKEPLGKIGDEVLDASVVRMIEARDGVDEGEARLRAHDTLRLVAARRAELGEDGIEDARRHHLERAALARLYLTEVFEPKSSPENIPADVVERALNDPSIQGRHFHPKLHFVCQLIAVPKPPEGSDQPLDAPDDPEWRARAKALLDPIERRFRTREKALVADGNCDVFNLYMRFEKKESDDGEIMIRIESQAFDVSRRDLWVPEFVDAMTVVEKPGVVPTFETKYGRHLVVVPAILEPNLEDGSAPEKELLAQRRTFLRETLNVAWRIADAYPLELKKLREKRTVRMSASLSGQ